MRSTNCTRSIWSNLASLHWNNLSPVSIFHTIMATPTSSPRKLKILMLHGYTQSGHLFEIKTKALKKSLEKLFPASPKPGFLKDYPGGLALFYPTGPLKLDPADIPGSNLEGARDSSEAYGWWKRKQTAPGKHEYDGLDQGLEGLAQALSSDDGPFDGVIGFSQGGAAAGFVASLLEPGRKKAFDEAREKGGMEFPKAFLNDDGEVVHPQLKFAVSYSGYGTAVEGPYRGFYEPKISTPMCHFIGSVDTVVEEAHSLRLVDACDDGRGKEDGVQRLVYHPGGHFLPSSQKQCTAALAAFIREALGEEVGVTAVAKKEEKAEDMDLPF